MNRITIRTAVLLASLSPLALAVPAAAQDTPSTATDATASATAPADENLEEIVITGTRRIDRTSANSASPIDVISATELTTQPTSNLMDTVKNIVPSFFVGQNTISDASTFVRSPSLRGLPGDETLVQINGKRFNRSALVQVYSGGDTGLSFGSQGADISAIPSIAIKNLQVLRDGATAQYGSDAIAGVMNFVMRNDRRGFQVEGRLGQYYDHGDTKLDSGLTRQIAGTFGVGFGKSGFFDAAAEYYDDTGTSRGVQRPIALIFAEDNPGLADQLPNAPLPVQIWGSSPQHGWKAMINSAIDTGDNSQLYVTLLGAQNKGNQSFNYRPVIGALASDPRTLDEAGVGHAFNPNGAFTNPFYLTPCPANNATCPAGSFVQDSNNFLFSSIYPAGFTPRFLGNSKERWGTLGWRGDLENGLTWDLSGTLAKNTLTLSMEQSLNASYGNQSQTEFQFGTLSQKEKNLNLDMTYPVNVGAFSPLTLSWGAEYRKETYGQSEGDPQSYGAGPFATPQNIYIQTSPGVYVFDRTIAGRSPGASGYGGTSPTYAGKWSQWNWGVYAGAEVDVTDALSVGVAGRYEDYNTFGNNFVYKANGIYKVSPQFSIRATLGTGFHAPSPGQAHDAILTTNFNGGVQVQTGTYPVDSVISRFYGSTTLGPEKSHNYGAGVVIRPAPNITMTIDGYIIDVKNRIGISQTFNVTAANLAAEPALAAVGIGGAVNYFTNGYDTSTKGVDFVGTWRGDLFGGSANATLAYNYNKSKVADFDPGVINGAQIINVAHLAPNHRATLSGNWTRGPISINARENYYGWWANAVDYCTAQLTTQCRQPTAYQKFGAKFTTDVDVSYTFMDHYTLTIGANNLFDEHPDKIAQSTVNPIYVETGGTDFGQVYPRNGGPFGINGGLYYVRVRVKY
jgi:iron complex outermembrane receptor protein